MPSARLELAQLSPLPPQDSVSTNFTTTARRFLPLLRPGLPKETSLPNHAEFYPQTIGFLPMGPVLGAYLEAAGAGPEAATGAGTGAALGTAPGTAPGAAPGVGALAAVAAGRSSTLAPPKPLPRLLLALPR